MRLFLMPGDTACNGRVWVAFAQFLQMAAQLFLGVVAGPAGIGPLDFLLLTKGALMSAAILALRQAASEAQRVCLDAAVQRTGSLLLVVGAASAVGGVLNTSIAFERFVPEGLGLATLFALFALTVAFKVAQGSSMATCAATAPVAAPIVLASGVHPILAVFATCLGSFMVIPPNDS